MTFPPRHKLGGNDMSNHVIPLDLPPSIDDLKLQVAAARLPRILGGVKEKLLFILHTFGNQGVEEAWIFSFVSHVISLSMEISILLEMMDMLPSNDFDEFQRCLEDIGTFSENLLRWNSYTRYTVDLREILAIKSSNLEQRLSIIFGSLKASFFNIQMKASCDSSLGYQHRFDNTSMGTFPNAKDFTVNDSHIFTVGGSVYFMGGNAAHPEDRYLQPHISDVELETELHIGKGYRLYRGNTSGRVVAVKVFEGRDARQSLMKTAELNRGIMHSNLLTIYGKPNHDSFNNFLLFRGDLEATVETELPLALMDGIQKTWILAANTIIGCARALLYLENIGVPLPFMGSDHFVPIKSKEGKVVIAFDADPSLDLAKVNEANICSTVRISTVTQVCSALIQKTFYASCQKFYPSERVYEDEGDQATSAYGPVVEDEAEQYLNSSDADSLPDVPTDTKFLAQSKGHRRELIWKSPNTSSWSLEDVARRYEASLRQSHFQKVLNSRQGSTARIGHYCRGYRRTEIILTPHLDQSGIISHTSPVPHEICSVCGEEVSEKEVFDCRCGSLDVGPVHAPKPTIKCNVCLRWGHKECARKHQGKPVKDYKCWRCDSSPPSNPMYQNQPVYHHHQRINKYPDYPRYGPQWSYLGPPFIS